MRYWHLVRSRCLYLIRLVQEAGKAFVEDNAIKLAASLSYYTIFSLPPMLIIIITLTGFFFGEEAVSGQLFYRINELVGDEAAAQIQQAVAHIQLAESNFVATVVGIGILLVTASTAFAEMQSSMNFIWGIQAKPNKSIQAFFLNRLISFAMIASLGFLLMVSLVAHALISVLHQFLQNFFPEKILQLFNLSNEALVFLVISMLFTFIFKFLPDAKIKYRDAFVGACFTSILFLIGKYAIGLYLGSSGIASVYGAAGSVIVILAWVYYSAIILYFGAEFTKVFMLRHGDTIIPNDYSVVIRKPCLPSATQDA
jgi:membrane protein